MATRQRKKKSDYGSVYQGHEGQWSWLLHRVTGVAIILFLFAHVVDTAVVGWGPEAYNRVRPSTTTRSCGCSSSDWSPRCCTTRSTA